MSDKRRVDRGFQYDLHQLGRMRAGWVMRWVWGDGQLSAAHRQAASNQCRRRPGYSSSHQSLWADVRPGCYHAGVCVLLTSTHFPFPEGACRYRYVGGPMPLCLGNEAQLTILAAASVGSTSASAVPVRAPRRPEELLENAAAKP